MRIHFVTFASPAFRVRQWLLNRSARWFGRVDCLHVWTKARLKRDGFIARHPELFPNSTGFGWYAWKPYIILQALGNANEGDLVIYQDVGRREPVLISRPLCEWDRFLSECNIDCVAGVSIPDWGPNRLWTKRSVFESLDLCGELYENEPQVQASWSVWRKCAHTDTIVREWTKLCQRLDLVGGSLENDLCGETPGFHEHRWDQSLLTLLALRDGLRTLSKNDLRATDLDEKSIDNFETHSAPAIGFGAFKAMATVYRQLEGAAKAIPFPKQSH